MKFRRVSALTKADLKKLKREPAAFFLLLLFPVILTLALGVSFGAIGGGSTTYQVGVVNQDPLTPPYQFSNYLIGNLTESKIIIVSDYSTDAAAQADLVQGRIQAVMIIPENFSESCVSFIQYPTNSSLWTNTTIQLYVDSGSLFATQAIPPIVQQAIVATVFGSHQTSTSGPIQIGNPSLTQVTKYTGFDFMAPGLFAFAAIFLIMIVAQSFVDERQTGVLRRINITPTTPAEFLGSRAISNMLMAIIQAALVFLTAFLIGFHAKGDIVNIIAAFIVVSIFSLCCIGFGLITAALAKSSGAATGLSFIFILPLMFLGTYVTTGLAAAQAISQFVPSYYATDALTSLLLRGAPVTSPIILIDMAILSAYSIAVLLIGVLLFRKYGRT